jgi:hypothetical protein
VRKPGVLAQFRLVQAVGAESAANQTYMQMINPLIYLGEIDGEPVFLPMNKARGRGADPRLGDEGLNAVNGWYMVNVVGPTMDAIQPRREGPPKKLATAPPVRRPCGSSTTASRSTWPSSLTTNRGPPSRSSSRVPRREVRLDTMRSRSALMKHFGSLGEMAEFLMTRIPADRRWNCTTAWRGRRAHRGDRQGRVRALPARPARSRSGRSWPTRPRTTASSRASARTSRCSGPARCATASSHEVQELEA